LISIILVDAAIFSKDRGERYGQNAVETEKIAGKITIKKGPENRPSNDE